MIQAFSVNENNVKLAFHMFNSLFQVFFCHTDCLTWFSCSCLEVKTQWWALGVNVCRELCDSVCLYVYCLSKRGCRGGCVGHSRYWECGTTSGAVFYAANSPSIISHPSPPLLHLRFGIQLTDNRRDSFMLEQYSHPCQIPPWHSHTLTIYPLQLLGVVFYITLPTHTQTHTLQRYVFSF